MGFLCQFLASPYPAHYSWCLGSASITIVLLFPILTIRPNLLLTDCLKLSHEFQLEDSRERWTKRTWFVFRLKEIVMWHIREIRVSKTSWWDGTLVQMLIPSNDRKESLRKSSWHFLAIFNYMFCDKVIYLLHKWTINIRYIKCAN